MNIIKEKYYTGINLGGWLSQCKEYSEEHYNSFITEADIKHIKALGFDHVRLPFDYHLIMEEERTQTYLESGFKHIERALSWCKKYDLNVILDLHKAPGYSFDTKKENQLFTDISLQDQLVEIWSNIAKRYKGVCGDEVIFELLNEIVEPDNSRWIILATRIINAISEIDSDRYIMVGGNNYNSCGDLKYLPLYENEKVVYTFHFYEPVLFTHQHAYWFDRALNYNQTLSYPGTYTNIDAFIEKHPEYEDLPTLKEEGLNIDAIKRFMAPAFEFIERTDKPLYCGEYGVIALTDITSRENWHRDVMSLFNTYEIGSGCWSYKEMDFEIVDDNREPISEALLNILLRK